MYAIIAIERSILLIYKNVIIPEMSITVGEWLERQSGSLMILYCERQLSTVRFYSLA